MLKRTITGVCYVAIIVAFFLLRQFVDYRLFHMLTFTFLVLGTYEIAKMTRSISLKGNFFISILYSVCLLPLYLIIEYRALKTFGWLFAISYIVLAVIIVCIICIIKKANKRKFFSTIAPYLYPSVFILPMILINEIGALSFIALLLLFVVSPLCDTMAYLVGSLIGGKKLCPKISPKKTWSGAIGGLFGGIIGGGLVYLILHPIIAYEPIIGALIFAGVGLISALLTEIGDLFESYIKRRLKVKDSGNILPGHGGVLDRIDGMLFAGIFIYIVFLVI